MVERPDGLVDLMTPPPPLHTGGDGRTGGGLSPCLLHIWGFVQLCALGCMLYFGSYKRKNESSVNALHTYETHERPEVSIYERTCACKAALQLLSGPRGPSAFPCTAPIDSAGSPNAPPPLFFSPSASFSLSSTFSVSLCFTLCLHATPWVVPSNNIWSFPGPPCQEFLFFWGVGKCPEPRDGSVLP